MLSATTLCGMMEIMVPLVFKDSVCFVPNMIPLTCFPSAFLVEDHDDDADDHGAQQGDADDHGTQQGDANDHGA